MDSADRALALARAPLRISILRSNPAFAVRFLIASGVIVTALPCAAGIAPPAFALAALALRFIPFDGDALRPQEGLLDGAGFLVAASRRTLRWASGRSGSGCIRA